VADRITGLELGADDYVVKPFSQGARSPDPFCADGWTKRASGIPSSGVIHVTNLRIDTNKRQVYKGDERIRLTGMEFSLLELLVSRSGEAFSRSEILQKCGDTHQRRVDTRVVDVHIRGSERSWKMIRVIELILTARGTGYLFQRIIEPGEE